MHQPASLTKYHLSAFIINKWWSILTCARSEKENPQVYVVHLKLSKSMRDKVISLQEKNREYMTGPKYSKSTPYSSPIIKDSWALAHNGTLQYFFFIPLIPIFSLSPHSRLSYQNLRPHKPIYKPTNPYHTRIPFPYRKSNAIRKLTQNSFSH